MSILRTTLYAAPARDDDDNGVDRGPDENGKQGQPQYTVLSLEEKPQLDNHKN